MKPIWITATLLALLAAAVPAQTSRAIQPPRDAHPPEDPVAAEKSTKGLHAKTQPLATSTTPAMSSYARSEVWRDVTIGPGQSIYLDSSTDFSYADSARVSVRSRTVDLPYLVITAYWTTPLAAYYNATDAVSGSLFPFTNVGGATFTSYGSQFRLRLFNNGYDTIWLSQVIVYARLW
jgi:hypothetical protein